MRSFRRIAVVLAFLIVTALLAFFLVYVSETLVKTNLCLDLRRSSISKHVCHPTDSYSGLLRGTFHIGVFTRIEVRNLLDDYWVASGDAKDFGITAVSDTYKFNAFFLGGQTVFVFDENDVLVDIQVDD